jgi:hypothetical protein
LRHLAPGRLLEQWDVTARKTSTADRLTALGAERLAAILVELAQGEPGVRRRLRLELAAAEGGAAVGSAVAKRLTALKGAQSFIDWTRRRDFVKDLDLQRATIVDRVAPTHPELALDLLWRFLDLAPSVLERVDDSTGAVGDVFRRACADLRGVACQARADPSALADRVFSAISNDEYGVFEGLVEAMLEPLGAIGTARLESRLGEALSERPDPGQGWDWHAIVLRHALQTIADGRADVDAWIALLPAGDRARPDIAAEIGRRLLAAGRTREALQALEAARPAAGPGEGRGQEDYYELLLDRDDAWEDVWIEALEADGQNQLAQEARWAAFEQRLSPARLRMFLKRLPDFEDFEAERRARQHAFGYRSFALALDFFHRWPDPAAAAQLVIARSAEIDGNLYFLLDPVAQQIEGRHPLAATLLRRAMIEDTLEGGKSSRYRHAARHLLECRALAPAIEDYAPFETHDAFVGRLRAEHGRKRGFWAQDPALGALP